MKIMLLGWMLMVFNFSFATDLPAGSFSGVVKDGTTGLPLSGVSVYIADLKVGTSTNIRGEYIIRNVSEGVHLVEISHIGYNTIADKVEIKGATVREYLLFESVIENNTVVVTGVTRATQLKKVPFQVSVLRKEEIQQGSSTNIVEAISRKPGVSALSSGPVIAKPLIRGLGYNRVLTLNDGIRQEGQQWGDEHGLEIDEASVSKVEVFKGPASLVYGSDAIAGVINIITNVPVQTNTFKANAGYNYQHNNRLSGVYGNVAGNRDGISFNLYGTTRSASDYKNKYDGYVFNSKFKEGNFGGYAGVNRNWGYSHIIFSSFDLEAGIVEGERDENGNFIKPVTGGDEEVATDADFKSRNPMVPYQHIRHFKVASDNNFKIGGNRLTLGLGWQRNQREEIGNVDDPAERELYFDLKTITYSSSFHFKENKGWKTSIGVNGMQQENENRGEEELIPAYTMFDAGLYGFTQKEKGRFIFSGGLRYDNRSLSANEMEGGTGETSPGFKRTFNNISGSLGLTAAVTKKVNLKFNVARAFRGPGIPELASDGAHEGTNRYEYGNRDLKSEISTQADAAIEYSSDHLSINLAGYINRFNNFIFYRKMAAVNGADSLVNLDGEFLEAFRFDQGEAQVAGMELSVDIHPHPLDWLHIFNSFSMVSGRLSEAIGGSKALPFFPAPRLLSEVRADFKKAGKNLRNLYFKTEVDNMFDQSNPFTAFNTETATPGYTIINAGFGGEVMGRNNNPLFNMSIIVSNLADVAYQNHLSRLKYAAENAVTGRRGVYGMGRNVSIRFNIPLSLKWDK